MKFLIFLVFLMPLGLQAKDLKVVGQEFMPYQGTGTNKKMYGAFYEVVKKVCEKIKANCTFEVVPLLRCLKMAETGEAHIVLGLAKIPEREAIAYFPALMSQAGYTFFVKKGTAAKYTKFEDFKGMTVAAPGGSATGKALIELNDKAGKIFTVVEEAVSEAPMRKLSGGRYGEKAAGFCTRPVCLYQAKLENLDVEPVSFDAKIQSHTIAISKKGVDEATFKEIKTALAEVMKTSEIKQLFSEHQIQIHPESQ